MSHHQPSHDPYVERLERCYSGILHDVMRAAGMRDFTLPPTLRPLIPGQKLCGPAFTVSGRVSTGSDAHETLLQWTGMLSKAKSGHVLVIQPNDSTVSHMGELSSETLKLKGVRGVIADGGVRDAEFIIGLGFQVWHRYFTPRDVVGYWLPDAFRSAGENRRGIDHARRLPVRRPRRSDPHPQGGDRVGAGSGRGGDGSGKPGAHSNPGRSRSAGSVS
ncbi:RraA family protein [Polaromonas sp. P1(28)-13]|nr:RraA family protein [Polaromonas sp. P1(28)-13]